ncbi:MAG: acyltransferase family protein [Acidimicrobiales bacterium]
MTSTLVNPLSVASATPDRRRHATRRARFGSFRADIQGVRALAVILVLLAHGGIPAFQGGFVGVDVFFVVSGFVITGQLLRQQHEAPIRAKLAEFYARRVKRIVPAATITLLATFALSYYWLGTPAARSLAVDERWASLFGANWRFAETGTNYFMAHQGSSLILNFWSLGVEEQFYLFFPLLMVVLVAIVATRYRRTVLACVCLVLVCGSACWCVYQTHVDPVGAYYSPFVRFWELGLGALIALVPRPWWIPDAVRAVITWGALLAIVAAALVLTDNGSYPGAVAWWPAGVAGLLLWCGGLGGRHGAERLLERRPMQFTGNISYSLYLWHYPILMLAIVYAGGTLPLAARLELLALSYGVAITSYYYIENPVRHWKLLGRHKTAAFGMAAIMLVSVWVVTGLGLSASSPAEATTPSPAVTPGSPAAVTSAVAAARAITAVPADSLPALATFDTAQTSYAASGPAFFSACDPYLHPVLAEHPAPCLFGDFDATRTVVLVGDSTAGNWAPALNMGLKKSGYRLAVFGYAGCPAPDLLYTASTASQYQRCNLWHSRLGPAIRALHPVAVIAVSGATDLGQISNRAWTMGYARLFADATRANPSAVRVLMGTSPEFAEPVPACLAAHRNPQQCSSRYTYGAGYYGAYLARDAQVAAVVATRLVPTHQWFCDQDVCEPVIGRYVAFADVEHLTIDYSEYLSRAVTARVLTSFSVS